MEKLPYAVCPRCGMRAVITGTIHDWEGEEEIALVKCHCGRSQVPLLESRIIHIDLGNSPYRKDHFDLLLPPGWTKDMWDRISRCLENCG